MRLRVRGGGERKRYRRREGLRELNKVEKCGGMNSLHWEEKTEKVKKQKEGESEGG